MMSRTITVFVAILLLTSCSRSLYYVYDEDGTREGYDAGYCAIKINKEKEGEFWAYYKTSHNKSFDNNDIDDIAEYKFFHIESVYPYEYNTVEITPLIVRQVNIRYEKDGWMQCNPVKSYITHLVFSVPGYETDYSAVVDGKYNIFYKPTDVNKDSLAIRYTQQFELVKDRENPDYSKETLYFPPYLKRVSKVNFKRFKTLDSQNSHIPIDYKNIIKCDLSGLKKERKQQEEDTELYRKHYMQ